MTTVLMCLLVAFLLNMLSKVPVAVAMSRRPGGYDNHHPRDQQAALAGWGRRALAAHQNQFEAFPAFGVGVLAALLAGATGTWLDALAVVFVVARVLYIALYIADLHLLRSMVWAVGFVATAGLYVLAAQAL